LKSSKEKGRGDNPAGKKTDLTAWQKYCNPWSVKVTGSINRQKNTIQLSKKKDSKKQKIMARTNEVTFLAAQSLGKGKRSRTYKGSKGKEMNFSKKSSEGSVTEAKKPGGGEI